MKNMKSLILGGHVKKISVIFLKKKFWHRKMEFGVTKQFASKVLYHTEELKIKKFFLTFFLIFNFFEKKWNILKVSSLFVISTQNQIVLKKMIFLSKNAVWFSLNIPDKAFLFNHFRSFWCPLRNTVQNANKNVFSGKLPCKKTNKVTNQSSFFLQIKQKKSGLQLFDLEDWACGNELCEDPCGPPFAFFSGRRNQKIAFRTVFCERTTKAPDVVYEKSWKISLVVSSLKKK